MNRIRKLSIVLAVVALSSAAFSLRPVAHLVRTIKNDIRVREVTPPGYMNDASRLNQTKVAAIWQIPVDSSDSEGQLRSLLEKARSEGKKVAIAGARHSMGGHTIYPNGISIDMLPLNKMELHEERNILTVQAGALWSDIIAYLDERRRSVAVMQSNNSFSVGGSISVNCHGWQYNHPPIASTVESFRLMQADGTIVRCSRSENAELFSLVLGGYGLFGIILDVDLRVVPNEKYRLEQNIVSIEQSLATFDQRVKGRPGLEMLFARMSIVPERLFKEVIINAFYRDEEGSVPTLEETDGAEVGSADLRRALFRGSAEDDYGKELRWSAETKIQPLLAGKPFSRNQLLNEGVELLENNSANTTDILQEYFVPRRRVAAFVEAMTTIIHEHDANLLNVTIRGVNEDTDSFLRYADQEMLAFVMLFVQERTPEGERKMKILTRDLIDAALEQEGRYYLTYRLHASKEQFHRAYPQARQFFELKRKYDPEELFQNGFYLEYGNLEDSD